MVGLLSLTEAESALQNFRAERGDDRTPPVPVLSKVTRHSLGTSGGVICGIAACGGFVFGAALMITFSTCLSRRERKY
jgi:hypothetical protein